MIRTLLPLSIALALVSSTSCRQKDPPATPPPAKATSTPKSSTPTPTKVSNDSPATRGLAKNESKQEQEEETPTASPPPKPQPPAPPPERLALLTPGGPLLLDVTLTINGAHYKQGFEAELDKVLAAADTNDDDRHTWTELIENADFLKSPLVNAANATGPQKMKWAEDYDFNDNDYLERDEAAAWLGRDSGRTARALAIRSLRAYSPDPRSTSRLWPRIDIDADGKLSTAEIQSAAEALLALDANDDLSISAAELVPLRDQLLAADGQVRSGRTNLEHFAILHLEPGDDPARLEYLLNDLYAPRQDLIPTSFSALPRLGDELDANDDDWLERAELANLIKASPHLKLTVAFGQAFAPDVPSATVRIDEQAPEVKLIAQTSPGRSVISVGGTQIVLSAHELAPTGYAPQPNYGMGGPDPNQIRLLAHDQVDAVFGEIDANADARLSEREVQTVPDRLLARDRDNNGELADDELPYSMIVAFVRGESPGEDSYYVPASPPPAAASATSPKWFTSADLNSDGEISRREFLGAAEHFAEADANTDGYIDADEAAATSESPKP